MKTKSLFLLVTITLGAYVLSLGNVPWNASVVSGQTVPARYNSYLPFVPLGYPNSRWINLGYSKAVFSIAIDPVTPSTLYIANNGPNVYKSTTGGGTWSTLDLGLYSWCLVHGVTIDPKTPSTLYAGSCLGLRKSTNGGESWSAANNGFPSADGPPLGAPVFDPLTPTTLYVRGLGTAGLFKSTDDGATWSRIIVFDPISSITAFVIDPVTPTTLYIVHNQFYSTLWKSTDGGVNWGQIGTPGVLPPPDAIVALAIDPVTPAILYAGTENSGVFKSADGGASWSPVNTGLSCLYITDLAVDPITPTTLYAATLVAGVFKSMNGGGNWRAFSTGLVDGDTINVLAIDPITPSTVYAGGWAGLFAIH